MTISLSIPSEMHNPKTMEWEKELRTIEGRRLFRSMPEVSGIAGRLIRIDGRSALNFSSNNYLGLAGHPKVIEAAVEAARRCGAGATASRLIAGNNETFRELEVFLAQWKQTESALVYGSGYQANLGIITALMDEHDLIVSDELNHASIIDGCRLSRARVQVYRHLNVDEAEKALKSIAARRKLLVTESVFSMDGDEAPLRELSFICRRWGAMFMVDEAHATGIRGPRGTGLAAELGVSPDIQMGTLGKAVGSAGAYVAGERRLIDFLINKSRSLIYTTAPTPATVGAALAGLKIIESLEGTQRRRRLLENAHNFQSLLEKSSVLSTVVPSMFSHIVPIILGKSDTAMKISKECLRLGIFVHGIRYPTVPENTARLRFTLMSDHTSEDVAKAVDILERAVKAVVCNE